MTAPVRILGELPAGKRWLTVPEVCAWLGVSEADWSAWRAAGTAPAHVTGADGVARVWVRHLERWLDTLDVVADGGETVASGSESDGCELAPVVQLDHTRRRGGTRRIGGRS
jgi:hypothetical protein